MSLIKFVSNMFVIALFLGMVGLAFGWLWALAAVVLFFAAVVYSGLKS